MAILDDLEWLSKRGLIKRFDEAPWDTFSDKELEELEERDLIRRRDETVMFSSYGHRVVEDFRVFNYWFRTT